MEKNALPKKVLHIIVLARETSDKEEIAEMKFLTERGAVTSLCFYPIRDAHYDEGFTSGELMLLDADTLELLCHTLINLKGDGFLKTKFNRPKGVGT